MYDDFKIKDHAEASICCIEKADHFAAADKCLKLKGSPMQS
jgi:hypothetical protein